jgi:hypothetical protein
MKHITPYNRITEQRKSAKDRVVSDIHDYSHYFEQSADYLDMAYESIMKDLDTYGKTPAYDTVLKSINMAKILVNNLEKSDMDVFNVINKHLDGIFEEFEMLKQANKFNL